MAELSATEVMEMEGREIFTYARQHRLSLGGCSKVDDFRERLVLHLNAQKGTYFDIQREFGARRADSMDSMRHTLERLMQEMRDAVGDLGPSLYQAVGRDCQQRIDHDGAPTASVAHLIQQRISQLQISQCSVILAGETNAGKSTFLNLLLGMDVLPTDIFSCTGAVCVLKYSDVFSAEIIHQDGRQESHDFPGQQEMKDWLKAWVAEEDEEKRQRGLGIQAINVHLPAVILQSGVTLVDTPGIGERETMTNCTMEYVKQNSAAAYLYLIKTDNAGGIHDDRLLEFLRAILHHNDQEKGSEVFNPSSALFICNRWDQVPLDQREAVKENALSKLRDVWPNFEPKQAQFMSSTNARMHYDSDPRYITQDYGETLKALKDMFGKARHNAIHQHYRWLKHVLHQSTSFLQTAIHSCSHTDDELISKFRLCKTKLDALQDNTTRTTDKLRRQMKKETTGLGQDMARILQEVEVKRQLLDWKSHPIPKCSSYSSKEVKQWQEEVDATIMRRIMDKVDQELMYRGLDQKLQERLKKMTQEELQLVDDEINSILSDITERMSLGSSISSNSSCTSVSEDESVLEMLKAYKERDGFRPTLLRNVSRVTEASRGSSYSTSSEATIGRLRKVVLSRLLERVLNPLAVLWAGMKTVRRRSNFNSDPVQYMKARTEKMVQVVAENRDCLAHMVAKHHDKLDAFITDVDNSIPRFIVINKQLMEDIKMNRKTYLSRRNELVAIMEALEPIRERLRGFGSLYIQDVAADNIHFMLEADQRRQSVMVIAVEKDRRGSGAKDSGLGGSPSVTPRSSTLSSVPTTNRTARTSQGLWSTYRWGHLAIGNLKQHVMARSYIRPLHQDILIKEIAHLRCLRSEDLAPFWGMSHIEESAMFLFKGDLLSAWRYLRKAFHEPRESVPRLLLGVVKGLSYLHREGMVHMELTLDTIMVTRDGDVRLCGSCLPRKARFPPDADRVDAEPFVCLSPEVLRGELYTSEDDLYGFGLVTWETCLRTKPYADHRSQLTLKDFQTQVRPSAMLGLDNPDLQLTDNLSAILRGCLLPARGLRTKLDELKERVLALRSDPVVQSLSAIGRRNVPLRRFSSAEDSSLSAGHSC